MKYLENIRELIKNIPIELIDFYKPRDTSRIPTQASSNFITHKEQGDWAENLIKQSVNTTFIDYIAVKYGKSDNIIAGEEGFESFYQDFQNELDTIGKRPDLLIFKRADYDEELGTDISNIPHENITDYIKKAIAGIEIRSSAFLIDRYETVMKTKNEYYVKKALDVKNQIISDFGDILKHPSRENYIELLNNITDKTLHITDFKVPGWRSNSRLIELNELFKQLKIAIKEIQKRDYLSITPKVEDLKVVYKWIETYNVPHYYFQVFFDKVYGISFEQIIRLISNSDNE